MQLRALGIAFASLAALSGAAHADCAREELGPAPITRAGAKIPADGGILVGTGASTDGKPVAGDPSQFAYKATAGSKAVSLVMASLAPGLTVFRPRPALTGALALHAGKTTVMSVTFDKAKGAALPAPVVSAVVLTTSPDPRGAPLVTAVASVAAVPDAAVALVVYEMKDEEHVPISYGVPAHDKTGATTVGVYRSGGRCSGPELPNRVAPGLDHEVVLAWVDAFGRLSPVSAAVKVK